LLREAYRGKAILLTGGTGFLGTALVEKILRSLPDLGRLYLLVRPSRGKSAAERFERDVFGAAAFRGLREKLGDEFEDRVSEKVRILEGDVHVPSLGLGEEDLAELSREVDVVIHSAASVIFDAPLDAAVDSNVRGTLGLLKLARGWEKRPLFMHISTAYVAGTTREDAPEAPPGAASPNGTALRRRRGGSSGWSARKTRSPEGLTSSGGPGCASGSSSGGRGGHRSSGGTTCTPSPSPSRSEWQSKRGERRRSSY
jgi:fatty acyl-CoA reductase